MSLKNQVAPYEKDYALVHVSLHWATEMGEMSFLVGTTVFGSPIAITLSESAVEVPPTRKLLKYLTVF